LRLRDELGERRKSIESAIRRADHDLVALGIAFAAILMFVGTGSSVLPQIVRSWAGLGNGPNVLLTNALLLNVALIIFGWRRYRELMFEIEQRRKAEESARKLAETDPLTGCLNRRSISPAADTLIDDEAKRGRLVAFLMIDLDDFKRINDVYGHGAGDAVLREVAGRIEAQVPSGSLVARLGGDEFACVVPIGRDEQASLDLLAERLVEGVARSILIDGASVDISISIGIAVTDTDPATAAPPDATLLMHNADIAMYHAKKRGKNRCYRFEEQMQNELHYRHRLESAIRAGIERGEFVPYYEQQVDLETGELVGFEMLARWRSDEFGGLGPTTFIPVAEEIGLIASLSEALIEQALKDARDWDPSLRLAVNISPIQMRDPWFAQKLLKLLVENNFPPARFEIEITESCLHDNVPMVRTLITSLRNQGVRISLDDFGTGYSNLSQLGALPFDQLKIDRTFVRELRAEGTGSRIVDAILKLGHGLDLPITAEGIENDQIHRELTGQPNLRGQGYHYGKPENAVAVRARLAAMGRLAPVAKPADEKHDGDAATVNEASARKA
jgi:diguanylate cyclase (GGDEF)-like protein